MQAPQPMGFNYRYIPLITALSASLAIVIGYVIAVHLGHTKPFPQTDITHTTIHYPEYYFARIGFPTTSILQVFNFFLIVYYLNFNVTIINIIQKAKKMIKEGKQVSIDSFYAQFMNSVKDGESNIKVYGKPIILAGAISSVLFLISISVITEHDMNWDLHIYGATNFFIICLLDNVAISIYYIFIWQQFPQFCPQLSYNIKRLGILAIILGAVGYEISESDEYKHYLPKYFGNMLEWYLAAVQMIYLGSYTIDFTYMDLYFQKEPKPDQKMIVYNQQQQDMTPLNQQQEVFPQQNIELQEHIQTQQQVIIDQNNQQKQFV